jgi:cell division initiation protein
MKLTPLDIHHKEFRHSLRGYSEEEVDAFLDEVADEFERLFKENIDLAEKLEAAHEKLREYEQMEKTVHNTLVAAQKSAEDIEAKAGQDAELTRKDAELRAKEIIHEALTLKQKTQNEFMRIKEAETQFRQEFRRMLEQHLSRLSEIPVPEDIAAMGQRQEMAEDIVAGMDSVQSGGEPAAAPAPEAAPEPPSAPAVKEAEPGASGAAEQQTLVDSAPEPQPESVASVAAETAAALPEEPPESGFVTGVQLGELDDTDLVSETPDYEEQPQPFEIPTLDSLGEREDDLDIEEID